MGGDLFVATVMDGVAHGACELDADRMVRHAWHTWLSKSAADAWREGTNNACTLWHEGMNGEDDVGAECNLC